MPDQEQDWPKLLRGLRDAQPWAVEQFFSDYAAALESLAAKHLSSPIRRRVGPEDIVQSACRTFFRRAKEGQFQLEDSDSLWRLLTVITMAKVREQTRFHLRQRRSLKGEAHLDSSVDGRPAHTPASDELPPEAAAEFSEQFQLLIRSLDSEEQQVVDLKLQQFTNDEVAERLGCSERTVRRLVKKIQAQLTDLFELGD
jgi:RNA polymerase sigma factor (sigma-70 family)